MCRRECWFSCLRDGGWGGGRRLEPDTRGALAPAREEVVAVLVELRRKMAGPISMRGDEVVCGKVWATLEGRNRKGRDDP